MMGMLLTAAEVIGAAAGIATGVCLLVRPVREKLLGLKVRWCSEEEYLSHHKAVTTVDALGWAWYHDRRYNREIDCSKVLEATGLTKADFASVEEGIRYELKKLGEIQ